MQKTSGEEESILTLQCSHLFFTELCTFIPLTCPNTPPATDPSAFGVIERVALVVVRARAGRDIARVADSEKAPKARNSEVLIVKIRLRGGERLLLCGGRRVHRGCRRVGGWMPWFLQLEVDGMILGFLTTPADGIFRTWMA